MTTLDDLYVYYCRHHGCKPNSGVRKILNDATQQQSVSAAVSGARQSDSSTYDVRPYRTDHRGDTYCTSKNTQTTSLSFRHMYLGPRGVAPALQLCHNLPFLTYLDLSYNRLGDTGVDFNIAGSIAAASHRNLAVVQEQVLAAGDDLGAVGTINTASQGLQAVVAALRGHRSLRVLSLEGNELHDGALPLLLALLRAVPHRGIDDAAGVAAPLAGMITHLPGILVGNTLTPAAVRRLEEQLECNIAAVRAKDDEAAVREAEERGIQAANNRRREEEEQRAVRKRQQDGILLALPS